MLFCRKNWPSTHDLSFISRLHLLPSSSRSFPLHSKMPLIMDADVSKLSGLAPRACERCRRKDGILRCSACQAVYYCGVWGILETRPYMRARYELVDAILLSYGTASGPVDVVQMALDHLLDMMRLCRGDNMGVRQLIPALYIRLGRDRDAYDFMKWYVTTSRMQMCWKHQRRDGRKPPSWT